MTKDPRSLDGCWFLSRCSYQRREDLKPELRAIVTRRCRTPQAFGFGAKLCIHPKWVPVIQALLLPSETSFKWARCVVAADAAALGAAVQLNGRLVYAPLYCTQDARSYASGKLILCESLRGRAWC